METINNANGSEVVTGQENNAYGSGVVAGQENNAEGAEVVTPQGIDVSGMDKDEFDEYISGLENNEETPDNAQVVSQQTNADVQKDEGGGENQPFKIFKTQEEYQSEIDGMIGKRLADVRQKQEQYEKSQAKFNDMMTEIKGFYNIDDDEKAYQMLIGDMREQAAQKRGMDVDTYVKRQEIEKKARAFDERMRSEQLAIQENAQIQAIRQRWDSEAAELKKTVPQFDLADTINTNPAFKEKLANGYSVLDAYKLTVPPVQTPVRRKPISQVGAGTRQAGSAASKNPANLPKKDFESYIASIMENV